MICAIKVEVEDYLNKGWHLGRSMNYKEKQRRAMRKRIWIHNDTERKMVVEDELIQYLELGWKRGRKIC
jgi:hypothetical protein